MLIGRHLAETFRKDFPLQFIFADSNDVTSVQAQISDEEENTYSSRVEAREFEGEKILNLKDVDSPVMIIPKSGDVELNDEIVTGVKIKQGEAGFVMASTNKVVIEAKKVRVFWLTLDK